MHVSHWVMTRSHVPILDSSPKRGKFPSLEHPLQASDIHLHAVIKSKDGGCAGGGRALLQVRDALVQALPGNQHCFGWEMLQFGGLLGGWRGWRWLLQGLLGPLPLGPQGGTGIGWRPVTPPASPTLHGLVSQVCFLSADGFVAVVLHTARWRSRAFALLWGPRLGFDYHAETPVTLTTVTSSQGPIAADVPRGGGRARYASLLFARFADFRIHLCDLHDNRATNHLKHIHEWKICVYILYSKSLLFQFPLSDMQQKQSGLLRIHICGFTAASG